MNGDVAGSSEQLDAEECPETVRLLETLFQARLRSEPDQLAADGLQRTPFGVTVDWERLAASSSDGVIDAVVHLAYGCGVLERAGGLPAPLRNVLIDTIIATADTHDPPTIRRPRHLRSVSREL